MKANIDEALEICLCKIKKGKKLEECLIDFPEFKEELEELISVALRIEKQPMINPDNEFILNARNNILNAYLKKQQVSAEKKSLFRLPRFTTMRKAMALALVFIMILTGTAFASSNALPGEALYPIKKGLERAQLAITFGPNDKAELEAKFALKRIDEVEEIEESNPELSRKTLLQAIESLNKVLQKAPNENVEAVIGNIIVKLENKRVEMNNRYQERELEKNQRKGTAGDEDTGSSNEAGENKPDSPPGQEKEKNNNKNGDN